MPEDKVQKAVQNILKHVNCTAKELRRLFLIEDLVDSIKVKLTLLTGIDKPDLKLPGRQYKYA